MPGNQQNAVFTALFMGLPRWGAPPARWPFHREPIRGRPGATEASTSGSLFTHTQREWEGFKQFLTRVGEIDQVWASDNCVMSCSSLPYDSLHNFVFLVVILY